MKRWDEMWWSCILSMLLMIIVGLGLTGGVIHEWMEGSLTDRSFAMRMVAMPLIFLVAFGIYLEYRRGMEIGQKSPDSTGKPPESPEKSAP